MKRRDLLKYLLATPIAVKLDVEKLLWVPGEKKIFIPEIDVSLYGIPYHEMNATTGTWLGIVRSIEPWPWKRLAEQLSINPQKGIPIERLKL